MGLDGVRVGWGGGAEGRETCEQEGKRGGG